MARRLIGLDVGTNAVTLAEVTPGAPPRLDRFGQVALPPGAMHEGEVVDDAAVTEAVARLRAEVDLPRTPVRLGIESPRLIVRQVEMPTMGRDELANALRFQAADLIPIPIEEALLDFAVLDHQAGGDAEGGMRILLAAAQQAMVMRLVAAVEAAGLPVGAVDLVPLALIRALARPAYDDAMGAEGIVSVGGGVTAITVHENGVPRFVRVLGTAGRELTDAVAAELEIPLEAAEALKRKIATGGDDLVTRAQAAIERPLSALLDEVRSSIDYYRNQPGAARVLRVVVTGGTSQLPGLPERLATLVGVPVDVARPRELLAIGDIGFAPEDHPRLDPYLPAAVGLALGGAGAGTVVDLLPAKRRGAAASSRVVVAGVAAGVALLALLGGVTLLARDDLADTKDERAQARAANDELRSQIAARGDAVRQQQQLEALEGQVASLLTSDVSWVRMLQEIGTTMPATVWLTSFQGQVTPATASAPASGAAPAGTETTTTAPADAAGDDGDGATTTTTAPGPAPGAPAAITGQVSFEAMGLDFPDVAAWLTRVTELPSLTELWVSNATVSTFAERDVVGFSSSAQLTGAARSDRLERFARDANDGTGGGTAGAGDDEVTP